MDGANETQKDEQKENVRVWEIKFKEWTRKNCPRDQVPGPHPDLDSMWNRDQGSYCKNMGIDWDPNDEEGEKDDY